MAITYPVLKSTTDSKKDNLIAYNAAVKNALDEVVALTGAAGEVSPVVRTNNPPFQLIRYIKTLTISTRLLALMRRLHPFREQTTRRFM